MRTATDYAGNPLGRRLEQLAESRTRSAEAVRRLEGLDRYLEQHQAELAERSSRHRARWSRLDGTAPRNRGANPRALGTNPKALQAAADAARDAHEYRRRNCPCCEGGWVLNADGVAIGRCRVCT